jgi:hypothetical protein
MPITDYGQAIGQAGTGVSDIFSGFGDLSKAQGDMLESQNYIQAADFAEQNEVYTERSTAIKEYQQDRENTMNIGQTKADIAGAGFANSGSGLAVLADEAGQGALTKAVIGQQGLITEAGYAEQAQSYENMASAAQMAAKAADTAAIGSFVAGGFQIAAAAFSGGALSGGSALGGGFLVPGFNPISGVAGGGS